MAERFTTPIAPCKYAHLQEPNVDQTGKYKPKFKITLVLDSKNPEHKELLTHISNLNKTGKGLDKKEELTDADKDKLNTKNPIKKQKDEDGNYTGLFEVSFKTNPDFVPSIPTFDSKGTKFANTKNFIANDSTVRVGWSYKFYEQDSGGVSLFLHAVQVIDLIEWAGGNADDFGFDEVPGGYVVEPTQSELDQAFGNTEEPPIEPDADGNPVVDEDDSSDLPWE